MRMLIRSTAILALGMFSLPGHTESRFLPLLSEEPLSHSISEVVEMFFVIQPVPHVDTDGAMIGLRLTLEGVDSNVATAAEGTFTLPGLVKVKIRHASTHSNGTACLLVSVGQAQTEWCNVPIQDGRLSYGVTVERSAAVLMSGVEIPVPAARSGATVLLYDEDTGKTNAASSGTGGVDVIPIAIIDDNGFINPSSGATASQHVGEQLQLRFPVNPLLPAGRADESATLRVGFVLTAPVNPLVSNVKEEQVSSDGFAKFRIETGPARPNGKVPLLVNGVELGEAPVEDDRVAYAFGVQIGARAISLSGEEIPIPKERARAITISISHVEYHGRTHSRYVIRPVVRGDSWSASP